MFSMLPDQESLEKRPNLRYLAKITIFYGLDPEELLSDYAMNISSGGVFIESNRILPEGTVLTVKFNLPDSDVVIYTHARVAWVNDPDNIKKSSLPPGMGIQFLNLSMEYMQTIRTFLNNGEFVPTW
jgi:uncharacterized protein (TIGR02266 family)